MKNEGESQRLRKLLHQIPGYLWLRKFLLQSIRYFNPYFLREEFLLILNYFQSYRQLKQIVRETQKYESNRVAVFVTFTISPFWTKFHGLIAICLRLRGYKSYVVLNTTQAWPWRFLRMMGLDGRIGEGVDWNKIVQKYSPPDAVIEKELEALLPSCTSLQRIKNLFFHNIAIGRHALSQTSVTLVKGRMDLANPKIKAAFLEKLYSAIQTVLVTEKWMDELKPSLLIVRNPSYIPNGPIYEVACLRGVDTIQSEAGQKMHTWLFKRHTPQERWNRYISISRSTWESLSKIPLTPEQDSALDREFEARYRPDSNADLRQIQSGKKEKSPEEVRALLNLDPSKKTAIIFSHVPFDAAFFYGEDLFEDFEQWFVETTRVACENPHLNWVLKLHPANVFKLAHNGLKEETELNSLRALGPLPEHIKLMRAHHEINTRSLIPVLDYGLTVRGSIGFELPCFGIPVLTGGTGAYSGFGFTIDSQSKEEFFDRLRNLHQIPRLSSEQTALARRHAYNLLLRRQTSFADVVTHSISRIKDVTKKRRSFWDLQFQTSKLSELQQKKSVNEFLNWVTTSKDMDFMF